MPPGVLKRSSDKRRLLELLKEGLGLRHARAPQPLSFGQEPLWFLERLEQGDSPYVIAAAVLLRGSLDTSIVFSQSDASTFKSTDIDQRRGHQVVAQHLRARNDECGSGPAQATVTAGPHEN